MEKYIQKINDKITQDGDMEKARKIKKTYQTIGGSILAVGLAGFLICFIIFMVQFFKYQTDNALICWFIAIPFLVLLIPGSILGRIGDALLPEEKSKKIFRFNKYKSQKEDKNLENK